MERKLVLRGLLAGGIGGLLAFVVARIFAEPQIAKAVGYEAGREAAQKILDRAGGLPVPAAGAEPFSRAVQSGVGIGAGMILFGLAMGGLFAVAYMLCLGRTGRLRARTLSVLVAGAGFLTMFLVPFVKYPANPPAVGSDDTIQARGGQYLLMVLGSILLLVAAVWLGQRLAARFGNWNATLLAAGAFVVAAGILMAVLPSFAEMPRPLTDAQGRIVFPGFPADVLASFRFAAVAAQLVLWTTIGLVFAPLAERLLEPGRAKAAARSGPAGV
jgi:hypothetical protein